MSNTTCRQVYNKTCLRESLYSISPQSSRPSLDNDVFILYYHLWHHFYIMYLPGFEHRFKYLRNFFRDHLAVIHEHSWISLRRAAILSENGIGEINRNVSAGLCNIHFSLLHKKIDRQEVFRRVFLSHNTCRQIASAGS